MTVGKKLIGQFLLQAGRMEHIQFHVDAGVERKVELRFSKYTVDAAQRRLSFMLQGTNLFSEQDLAA